MRLAISGGRAYRFTRDDTAFLDELHEACNFDEVVEGGAPGSDEETKGWGDENMIPVTTFHAAWRRPGRRVYDPGAGPKRNRRMGRYIVTGPAVWVFMPGGDGTEDAYRAAIELRKTHSDLVIVDRRNVRGPQKIPFIRPAAAPRSAADQRPHGSDSSGGSFAGDW